MRQEKYNSQEFYAIYKPRIEKLINEFKFIKIQIDNLMPALYRNDGAYSDLSIKLDDADEILNNMFEEFSILFDNYGDGY